MSRLLSAGFSRLKRDKVLWIGMFIMLIYSVICMLNGCRQATSDVMSEYQYSLDHYYFNYAYVCACTCVEGRGFKSP